MDDPKVTPVIRTRGSRRVVCLLALAVWSGLIFGTSCTVITPQRFFDWISAHALTDEASFRKFAVFWGFSWFAIVKGWHATEFAILFSILKAALDRLTATHPRRNLALALVLCLLFATSDEYHQSFVPGRNGTWTDVAIDALGACLAALIARLREGRNGGRGMIKRVVLFGSLLIVGDSIGCDSRPSDSTVLRFEANDYQFEYDGQQKKITIAPGLMRMVRHPENIEVLDGVLRVGRRDYGAVARKDKISVVAGKVAVNGQERKPLDP
jgi:VanZ like family